MSENTQPSTKQLEPAAPSARDAQRGHGRRQARSVRSRAAWTIVLSALALLTVGGVVTGASVDATVTTRSTVTGNHFDVAKTVDAGVYDLSARPATGDWFGPGSTLGVVRYKMHPQTATPVPLAEGETVVTTVRLPQGMQTEGLESPTANQDYRQTWSTTEVNGHQEVTSTIVALRDAEIMLPESSIAVRSNLAAPVAESALQVEASATFPNRITSVHPSDVTTVRARWNVETGVYNLRYEPSAVAQAGDITAMSLPTLGRAEDLYLRPGDVIRTTFDIPSGVYPGSPLPAASQTADRSISWSSAAGGKQIVRTEKITAPITTYTAASATFPVALMLNGEFTISASTSLPERFVSAQPRMSTLVTTTTQPAAPGFTKLAAGNTHSNILDDQWRMRTMGTGKQGQLGLGKQTSAPAPATVNVSGVKQWDRVADGSNFTIARVSATEQLWGWGANQAGQTGTGSSASTVPQPQQIGAGRYSSVAAGSEHAVAIGKDGNLYAWGSSAGWATGTDPAHGNVPSPRRVTAPAGLEWVFVEAGNQVTYAVDRSGGLWGMGSNQGGRLGFPENVPYVTELTPIYMPDGSRISDLSSSNGDVPHTVARSTRGELFGWGSNSLGQLGNPASGTWGNTVFTPGKIQLEPKMQFRKIQAGSGFTVGIVNGTVWSWGTGPLGHRTITSSRTPVKSDGNMTYVFDIAAGSQHVIANGSEYKYFGWGDNTSGQLGVTGSRIGTPTEIKLPAVRAFAAEEVADAEPEISVDDDASLAQPEIVAPEVDPLREEEMFDPEASEGDTGEVAPTP